MRVGNVGRRRDKLECKNGKPDNGIPNSNVMNQQMMIPNMFPQGMFVYTNSNVTVHLCLDLFGPRHWPLYLLLTSSGIVSRISLFHLIQ